MSKIIFWSYKVNYDHPVFCHLMFISMLKSNMPRLTVIYVTINYRQQLELSVFYSPYLSQQKVDYRAWKEYRRDMFFDVFNLISAAIIFLGAHALKCHISKYILKNKNMINIHNKNIYTWAMRICVFWNNHLSWNQRFQSIRK